MRASVCVCLFVCHLPVKAGITTMTFAPFFAPSPPVTCFFSPRGRQLDYTGEEREWTEGNRVDEEINALCIRFLNNFFLFCFVVVVVVVFSPEEAYTQCSITIFITLSRC